MIRSSLKRLATEALRAADLERDASRVCIYTAPWVMAEGGPLRDGAVAIDHQGRVIATGSATQLRQQFSWARSADLTGILMPGFVNAHARLEVGDSGRLPHSLGITRKLQALREMRRADDRLDPDSREAKIRAAVRRSVAAGNAAVGDVTDSLRAVPAMGREGLYGIVFHEVGEFSKRRAAKALAAAAIQRARVVPWPDGIRYRLAPHFLFSTAESALRELLQRANAELPAYAEDLGVLEAGDLLVHMHQASRDVIQQVGQANTPLVLCPRSALRDTGELPPLPSLLEEGCRIALGTDSPASAPDQSVLREAAELHAAFPEVPALALFAAATSGGADALGLDSMGSLEPGKAPGLLHADLRGATTDDPAGWLLRAGNPDLAWIIRPAPPRHAA
jgi:cytosine/adenosine deaminase-related metal-dependent hydrolase